jgi:hypothetical protein
MVILTLTNFRPIVASMFNGQHRVGGADSGQNSDEHNMMHGGK